MQKTTLICNNFSGINRSSSVFDSSIITATDIQNVELFSTESNSGVGIRTAKGNISISNLLPENEVVVNIFESIQKNKTYFFVHAENEKIGKVYKVRVEIYNPISKEYKGRSYMSAPDNVDGYVYFNSEEKHNVGDLVDVQITEAKIYDLIGVKI